MKAYIAFLTLIVAVAGDVSHLLNREYLPPVLGGAAGGSGGGFSVSAGGSAGASFNAGGNQVSYTAQQQSFEYTQPAEEAPAATYEQTYASEPVQSVDVPAPIGGDPITYGTIDGGDSSYYSVGQDAGAQVAAVEVDNSILSDSYGTPIGAQAAYVSGPAAQGPTIRAPQNVVAQYVSGSSGGSGGIETQYAADGGYIY